MIKLYGFVPSFGLPDPGPFVLKTEVQLKMLNLDYRRELNGLPDAPKGRLPYINDNGTVVADSTFIRSYLEKKYAVDLDAGFDESQRSFAWTVERFVEDHIYWTMVYSRWAIDENFAKGPSHFYDGLPEEVQQITRDKSRSNVLTYLRGQGIGRHSIDEIGELAARSFTSLSQLLGDNPFLLGDRPCGADASVFAQIASTLTPWFESPVRDAAQAHQNLVAYSDRMMVQYYPDFARVS